MNNKSDKNLVRMYDQKRSEIFFLFKFNYFCPTKYITCKLVLIQEPARNIRT